MDQLSYEDFVRAHGLAPLVDIKTACKVANVGHSRFYDLVKEGVFVLIPNGARRNVTAQNLHRRYLALIEAAESAERTEQSISERVGYRPQHALSVDTLSRLQATDIT